MSFNLLPLPYAANALGPLISQETIEYHYGKHHRKYVETLSALLLHEPGLQDASLVEVIRAASASKQRALFNNAAQVWSHNFYWHSICPPGAAPEPEGELARLIGSAFGSVAGLASALCNEAEAHFSNGWVWLLLEEENLVIRSFHDADTPLVHAGVIPLLNIDVWEHAYYIDYRNDRADYATAVTEGVLNWSFAAMNLDGKGADRADQRPEQQAASDVK